MNPETPRPHVDFADLATGIGWVIVSACAVVLTAVVIWRRGWQRERGEALGREVGEAMARHFGERLGWMEVRLTELLEAMRGGFARLGVRPIRVEPPEDPNGDLRRRTTLPPR